MEGNISIELGDGRCVEFDEIVILDLENENWIRCVRHEPSSRQDFPETTKYYHFENDVEHIEIRPKHG
jgi:hypothetical protein